MRILFVIITICFNLNLTAQNIIGAWSGNLDIQGQQMELIFHLKKKIMNILVLLTFQVKEQSEFQ